MKKDWHTYAILALAAISWWYFQTSDSDRKRQDVAQWQEWSKTKECLMTDLSRIRERMAHIEGFHEAERQYKRKP